MLLLRYHLIIGDEVVKFLTNKFSAPGQFKVKIFVSSKPFISLLLILKQLHKTQVKNANSRFLIIMKMITSLNIVNFNLFW